MMAADGGPERFREILERAEELTAFQVRLVLERTDTSSPSERDRALAEVAPVLAGMGETASRDELIRKVAERLELEAGMGVGRGRALEPAGVMGRGVAAPPATGGGEERPAEASRAAAAQRQRRPAELTSRERRERGLPAICIALPSEGREYLARLTDAHLSPSGLRAAARLREHPQDPASNLPREDGE